MPRRRELAAVASGLLGSFVSRNNDVGGYWAIGKLYRHAIENDAPRVVIDLMAKTMAPSAAEFEGMVSHYAEVFGQQCNARHLPADWVAQVQVWIRFDVAPNDPLAPSHSERETPFECVVAIEDDLGRTHTAQHQGWCAPHDPARERRSGRS